MFGSDTLGIGTLGMGTLGMLMLGNAIDGIGNGRHRDIRHADTGQTPEPLVQPRTARIEFVDYLPSICVLRGRSGSDVGDRHHLDRPRRQRPRPPQTATLDRLQFDVIRPFAGRQWHVELHPLIRLKPWLGRPGRGFRKEQRLDDQRLGFGRRLQPHSQFDRAGPWRPPGQKRIDRQANDLSRTIDRRRAAEFHTQSITGSGLQRQPVAIPIEHLLLGVQHEIGNGGLEGRAGSFIAVGMEFARRSAHRAIAESPVRRHHRPVGSARGRRSCCRQRGRWQPHRDRCRASATGVLREGPPHPRRAPVGSTPTRHGPSPPPQVTRMVTGRSGDAASCASARGTPPATSATTASSRQPT
jgi:hypothetical protein